MLLLLWMWSLLLVCGRMNRRHVLRVNRRHILSVILRIYHLRTTVNHRLVHGWMCHLLLHHVLRMGNCLHHWLVVHYLGHRLHHRLATHHHRLGMHHRLRVYHLLHLHWMAMHHHLWLHYLLLPLWHSIYMLVGEHKCPPGGQSQSKLCSSSVDDGAFEKHIRTHATIENG